MKKSQPNAVSKRHITYAAIATLLLLTLPLIAMLFNPSANWGAGDFLAAAILLFGSGLLYILISSRLQSKKSKLLAGIAILIILLIIWAELAVGIFN